MNKDFKMSMLDYIKYDEAIKSSFFEELSKIIGNDLY